MKGAAKMKKADEIEITSAKGERGSHDTECAEEPEAA